MGQVARANRLVFIGRPRNRAMSRPPCVRALACLTASAIALSSSIFAAESTSPLVALSPTLMRYAAEAEHEDDEDNDDEQITPYIEELFLGKIVYPQEAGEVQLTGGYFHGDEGPDDSTSLFEIEYGITDQLQIGVEAATHSARGESFQDLQQCSVEVYCNFYSDRRTGGAYGVGFEFGLPVEATADEPRACVYEPFFVAYQDYHAFAVNLSAALEIADPVVRGGETDVGGDVTLAGFRRVDKVATILEANVEFDSEESPLRLAPGLYWRPFEVPLDLAVSLPIGLNGDAPNLGAYALVIYEFPASALTRR